jgi:Glucose-6-phosphate dehydrogenase subunit
MTTTPDLGPHPTTLAAAYSSLASLWQRSRLVAPSPTRHLLVITHAVHLPRLRAVLGALRVGDASRQSLIVLGEQPSAGAQVSLARLEDGHAERLEVSCSPQSLLRTAEALIRPELPTHLWWGCDHAPPTDVLRRLGDLAQQVILDTVSEPLPPVSCPVADLSWVRSGPWRALVAASLATPHSPSEAALFEVARVRYSGDPRPAQLFAAWLATRLGWTEADRVQVIAEPSARQGGDLIGVELTGSWTPICWTVDRDTVQVRRTRNGNEETETVPFPPLSLAEGLGRVLADPLDAEHQPGTILTDFAALQRA